MTVTESSSTWNFRPSALQSMIAHSSGNEIITQSTLIKHYHGDNASAKDVVVPARRPHRQSNGFRACQWNIHCLEDVDGNGVQLAKEIADELEKIDADVIVLNEFGYNGRQESDRAIETLASLLEATGYKIHCAACSFPTVSISKMGGNMCVYN
jgi:uncharacterized protein CbrC (UPF0167 family)